MSPFTTTINISGMTSSHCVASVTEELEILEGVSSVSVELAKGGISSATITSGKELPGSQISEAVAELAEAGYLVVADRT